MSYIWTIAVLELFYDDDILIGTFSCFRYCVLETEPRRCSCYEICLTFYCFFFLQEMRSNVSSWCGPPTPHETVLSHLVSTCGVEEPCPYGGGQRSGLKLLRLRYSLQKRTPMSVPLFTTTDCSLGIEMLMATVVSMTRGINLAWCV